MVDNLQTKLKLLLDLCEKLESELINIHTALYRLEAGFGHGSSAQTAEHFVKIKALLFDSFQTKLHSLKNEISYCQNPKTLRSNDQIKNIERNQQDISNFKEKIKEQNALLKQLAYHHNESYSPLATSVVGSKTNDDQIVNDFLTYLSRHYDDKEIQLLLSPLQAKSSASEKTLINSIKSRFFEVQNPKGRSPTYRRAGEHNWRATTEHKEFSVYSDFSFQAPMEENREGRKKETIREDLNHVELDDILRISSLPISIQSDDEYRNYEFSHFRHK